MRTAVTARDYGHYEKLRAAIEAVLGSMHLWVAPSVTREARGRQRQQVLSRMDEWNAHLRVVVHARDDKGQFLGREGRSLIGTMASCACVPVPVLASVSECA
jgi:hypothetical protein